MIVKPVVLHGQHRIHIDFGQLIKGGVIFLAADGSHFIFQAYLSHRIPIHVVTIHDDHGTETDPRSHDHGCQIF